MRRTRRLKCRPVLIVLPSVGDMSFSVCIQWCFALFAQMIPRSGMDSLCLWIEESGICVCMGVWFVEDSTTHSDRQDCCNDVVSYSEGRNEKRTKLSECVAYLMHVFQSRLRSCVDSAWFPAQHVLFCLHDTLQAFLDYKATFSHLPKDESVTLAGRKFTAGGGGATNIQVAAAFAQDGSKADGVSSDGAWVGKFVGAISDGWTVFNSRETVTFSDTSGSHVKLCPEPPETTRVKITNKLMDLPSAKNRQSAVAQVRGQRVPSHGRTRWLIV
jgi:hypothetical protein